MNALCQNKFNCISCSEVDSLQGAKIKNYSIDYLHIYLNQKDRFSKEGIVYVYYYNDTLRVEKFLIDEDCIVEGYSEYNYVTSNKVKAFEDFIDEFDAIEAGKCFTTYHHLTPEQEKYLIGFSSNQWEIFLKKSDNYGDFRHAFKHRLLKFRCLSLKENLKQRRIVNDFFRIIGLK